MRLTELSAANGELDMEQFAYSVDIGGTSIKIGFFSGGGKLIEKWEIQTRLEDNGSNILPDIAEAIKAYTERNHIDFESVAGIGVGVPGPVDSEGTVNKCANLGWNVTDVAGIMKTLTGLEIVVDNDANVAALGEMWKGGGCGYNNIVFVTLGTGIGGGIIIDGKIVGGTNGAAGEIGHMPVNTAEKEQCGCGKCGCLEQYASATGVVRKANELLKDPGKSSGLRKLTNITSKDVWLLAGQGDEVCMETVAFFGAMLAQGLAAVACVCDPDIFVIGGGVSEAGKPVIEAIRQEYRKLAFHASSDVLFTIAKLGNDAGIYGCAYKMFSSRI